MQSSRRFVCIDNSNDDLRLVSFVIVSVSFLALSRDGQCRSREGNRQRQLAYKNTGEFYPQAMPQQLLHPASVRREQVEISFTIFDSYYFNLAKKANPPLFLIN